MTGIEEVAIAAAVVADAASATAGVMGAQAQAKAVQAQADSQAYEAEVAARNAEAMRRQYEQQAQDQKTAALEAEAQRRDELVSTLGSIDTIRASRGLSRLSPTGQVLRQVTTQNAEANLSAEKVGLLTGAEQSSLQANQQGVLANSLRVGAKMAQDNASAQAGSILTAGYVGAGATLASSGLRAYSLLQPRATT